MPTITNLNETVHEGTADNLVLAGELPLVHKVVEIANPKTAAIMRGMAVIATGDNDLCVAGTSGKTGSIAAIVAENMKLDATSNTLAVDCYVFGAFNAGAVYGLNGVDLTTAAYVLGAQGNGIYLI